MVPLKALFCRGEEKHELWSSLLEKALAKANGCYENLMHGETRDALRDLTGGVADKLQWKLARAPAAPSEPTATPAQAAPAPAAARVGAGVASATGGVGLLRPRVAGWGVAAGTSPPLGWIFEEMRNRLLEGQILGCRQVLGNACSLPFGPTNRCFAVVGSSVAGAHSRGMHGTKSARFLGDSS